MIVREAGAADPPAIWRILEPILRAGETYALPRDMSEADALALWTGADRRAYVAEAEGAILGTYYLKPNQFGGGAHVANCGYAVAEDAAGRGVASAKCAHSLDEARRLGFRAMQFNFVIETNARAVRLWRRFGFETIGSLPRAFVHPRLGDVDALVMRRDL